MSPSSRANNRPVNAKVQKGKLHFIGYLYLAARAKNAKNLENKHDLKSLTILCWSDSGLAIRGNSLSNLTGGDLFSNISKVT